MSEAYNECRHTSMPDYPYINKCRKNLSDTPQYHDELEIIAVLSGSVTAYCSSGTVKAEAGDLVVLMPKEIHHFHTEVENSVHVIKLHCKNSADTTDYSNYCFSGSLIKHGTELNQEVLSHINKMACLYEQDTKGAAYAANAHANMILSLILSSDKCVQQESDIASHNEATRILLRKVTKYINAHFRNQISLECIATQCNMSKYYFAHTFKEAMGVTFLEYLTSYRMEIAIRLLSETPKNITEISNLSGFANTRMFNHLFKAKFGTTPTEYRKSNSNNSINIDGKQRSLTDEIKL